MPRAPLTALSATWFAPRVPCANGEPPGGGLAAAVFKWESAGIALPVGGAASSLER